MRCEVGDVYASVRTAWDAFLLEKAFPTGSEVVFSAVTIPHMADIALAHGMHHFYASFWKLLGRLTAGEALPESRCFLR